MRTRRSRRRRRKPAFRRTILSVSGRKSCSRPSSKAACRLPHLLSIGRLRVFLRLLSTLIAAAGAALLLAGVGGADAADTPDPVTPSVLFGVSDDHGKYDDD